MGGEGGGVKKRNGGGVVGKRGEMGGEGNLPIASILDAFRQRGPCLARATRVCL